MAPVVTETPPPHHRPFATLPRNIAPLGIRNFAIFWIGFATSNAGRTMELVGSLWLTYELTSSPALVGLLGLARVVPSIVIGSVAGVVADRTDQRRLIMVTRIVGAAVSVALGVLIITGLVQLWHVYAKVLISAGNHTFDQAARHALFPRLVPRQLLPEAVTLSASAARLSTLMGPPIGGLAIATFGVAAPFLLNAATDVLQFGATALIRGVAPRTKAEGSSLRIELVEGLRHISHSPILRGLLTLEVVFHLFHVNSTMTTVIGREVLDVGPAGLGGLLAAPALGALLGIVLILVLGQPVRQGRFSFLCAFAYAGGLLILTLARDYAAVFVMLMVLGSLDSLIGVTRQSVLQLATPGRLRGRTTANTRLFTATSGELSHMQTGFVAGALGVPLALTGAAAALVVGGLLVRRNSPELWRFARDQRPDVVPSEAPSRGPT